MVEQDDSEDKAIIDEISTTEEEGLYWEESWDCKGGDEGFSLLPLVEFSKSLPFPTSTVIGIAETFSSSSFEWVKSIVEVGTNEIKDCSHLRGSCSICASCWCICNFGMYSSLYLLYWTLMFILGCVCKIFDSCHAPMFLLGDSIM